MSFVRRLAVGLPAAGVTAFAALAVSSPALAAASGVQAGHPVVMASPDRGHAGYGAEAPAAVAPAATTAVPAAPATAAPTETATGGTRGHKGYGSPAPSLPAGQVAAASIPPSLGAETATPSPTTKGEVSSGSLPLTGGPVGATVGVGAVLVAAGAGALWYTRRRKIS